MSPFKFQAGDVYYVNPRLPGGYVERDGAVLLVIAGQHGYESDRSTQAALDEFESVHGGYAYDVTSEGPGVTALTRRA